MGTNTVKEFKERIKYHNEEVEGVFIVVDSYGNSHDIFENIIDCDKHRAELQENENYKWKRLESHAPQLLEALQETNKIIWELLQQGVEGSFPIRSQFDKNQSAISSALGE